MKKYLEKLEWIFDYYVAYFLYNPHKIESYYKYMRDRWDIPTEIFSHQLKDSNLRRIFSVRSN